MSDSPFLPPPVRFSQAFESGNSSGGGITRRTFIKRTGGATVATMVAWNLTVNETRAEGGNPPGHSSHCPTHGSYCEWIKKVDVNFFAVKAIHPAPNDPNASGRVYVGTLTYTVGFCKSGKADENRTAEVTSGGFHSNKHLVKGILNDTSTPPGNYHLNLTPTGDIKGFDFEPMPPHRTFIEIHDRQRPVGSSGCVAFTDAAGENGPWDKFYELMLKNKMNCPHNPPNPVPLTVRYSGGHSPNFVWKEGHSTQEPCNNCT